MEKNAINDLDNSDYVVLLHGLGRNEKIMAKMSHYLECVGYQVCNIGYPSTSLPINELVELVYKKIQNHCSTSTKKINFVVHSLSAILIHIIIHKYQLPQLGRVVALSPPYHGSEVANFFEGFPLFNKIYGPAGLALKKNINGIVPNIAADHYELGVIAGNKAVFFDLLFSWFLIKGPDDGKVSVESTKIPGMRDHIVLPVNHFFFPKFDSVIDQTAFFLENGRFMRL